MSKFFLVVGLPILFFGLWLISLDEGGGDFRLPFGFFLALVGTIMSFPAAVSGLSQSRSVTTVLDKISPKTAKGRALSWLIIVFGIAVWAVYYEGRSVRPNLPPDQIRRERAQNFGLPILPAMVEIVSDSVLEQIRLVEEERKFGLSRSRSGQPKIEVIGILPRPIQRAYRGHPIQPAHRGEDIIAGQRQENGAVVWVSLKQKWGVVYEGREQFGPERKTESLKFFLPPDSIKLIEYPPGTIIKLLQQPGAGETGSLRGIGLHRGGWISWEGDPNPQDPRHMVPPAPMMNAVHWFRTDADEWRRIDPAWGDDWRTRIISDSVLPGNPLIP